MQHRTASNSEPPPSCPPPSEELRGRSSIPMGDGWRPADDDDGPRAVAWRARTGLRRADRALTALGELNQNVARLNETMAQWSATIAKRWRTVSRVAWGAGIPILVAVILGLGGLAWEWVSTLRH